MPKFRLLVTCVGALAGMALFGGPAGATMPGAPDTMKSAVDSIAMIDNVQYVWRGQRFCFYPDGWQGPGWYRCGYHLRVGFGWGGPVGDGPHRCWNLPGLPTGGDRRLRRTPSSSTITPGRYTTAPHCRSSGPPSMVRCRRSVKEVAPERGQDPSIRAKSQNL